MNKVDFTKAAITLMPHTSEMMVVTSLIKSTALDPGFCFDCLQHTVDQAKYMTGLECAAMLELYCQWYSVMCISACLHDMIWQDNASIFVLPFAKVADNKAGPSRPLGLKAEVVHMMKNFNASISELDSLAQKLIVAGVDSRGFNLRRSAAACRQWAENIASYQGGARKHLLSMAGKVLQEQSDTLEGCMPRWDTVCNQKSLDKRLLRARVLDHPRRAQVKPLVSFLKALLGDCAAFEHEWQEFIDSSVKTFVTGTIAAATHYLVISAAANTILNFSKSDRASKMADEVLAIADKQSGDFTLPDPMRRLLLSMSVGMPEDHTATADRDGSDIEQGPSDAASQALAVPTAPQTSIMKSEPQPTIAKNPASASSSSRRRRHAKTAEADATPPPKRKRKTT